MKFLDLAKQRYSCRSYKPTSVEKEKIDYVMECVRMAPSAVNRQPWRFRIVSDADGLEKICQCYNREWMATAPAVIIASIVHDEEWVRSDGKHHGDIDIAIAVEHLCLAATEQDSAHAGYAISMLLGVTSYSALATMRRPLCSYLSATLPTSLEKRPASPLMK